MAAKIFLIIALSIAVSNCVQLQCKFKEDVYSNHAYSCAGILRTTLADYSVDSVTGDHVQGKSNDDVTSINFFRMAWDVFPKNLNTYFKNIAKLELYQVTKLSTFKRSDFTELAGLNYFVANGLESITTLPVDAFYDLTSLRSLILDGNRNMGNLHEDLLINQRQLEIFSAHGPNKIDQISPGFFRNQQNIRTVAFTGTSLLRVGHSVFANMPSLQSGQFEYCDCLNNNFHSAEDLTTAVRAGCQDVRAVGSQRKWVYHINGRNQIWKTWESRSDEYDK